MEQPEIMQKTKSRICSTSKSPEQIVGIVKKSTCTAVVHWRRIAELLGKSKNLATHGGNVAGLMFQLTVL
jgi:hypothetical protein